MPLSSTCFLLKYTKSIRSQNNLQMFRKDHRFIGIKFLTLLREISDEWRFFQDYLQMQTQNSMYKKPKRCGQKNIPKYQKTKFVFIEVV